MRYGLERRACGLPSLTSRGHRLRSVRQSVRLQFLAQRAAIDAENVGGAALVAVGVVEHRFEQRLFDFAQHQIVSCRACGRSASRNRNRALRRSSSAAASRAWRSVRWALCELSFFFWAPWALRQRLFMQSQAHVKRAAMSAAARPSLVRRLSERIEIRPRALELRRARLSPASRHVAKRAPCRRGPSHTNRCVCARPGLRPLPHRKHADRANGRA